MRWILLFLCWIIAWVITILVYNDDKIDTLDRTIERMKVWQKNQEDREKQLLERIKFLESNNNIWKQNIKSEI